MPFFIKPIVGMITSRVSAELLVPEFKTRFEFLEDQLATSPQGGPFLCGDKLTAADMHMLIPLQTARTIQLYREGEYPRIDAWVGRMEEDKEYRVAAEKVEALEGTPFTPI
jgi:glutathione S-transferase